MTATRTALLSALLLCGWACSSVLGLDEFEDRRPDASGGSAGAGASGGTGGDGGSAGSAGSSGSAGAAGSAGAPFECQLDVDPFTLLDVVDPVVFAPNGEVDDGSLYMVRDPGSQLVHVVITGVQAGNPAVAVASVLDDNGVLGSRRIFSVPSSELQTTSVPVRLVDGIATFSELTLYGWVPRNGAEQPNNAWLRIRLDADANGPIGGEEPTQLPPVGACLASDVTIINAAFSLSGGATVRVAATCDQPSERRLVAGPVDESPDVTLPGAVGAKNLEVEDYVFSDGIHLVQAGGSSYRFGNDPISFAVEHTLDLGGSNTNGIALVPRDGAALGAIVVAARILTGQADSELRTAELTPPEYSELDIVEPAPFVNGGGVDGNHLAARLRFGIDEERLAAAAVNPTDSSVRLHYLTRNGAVLALGYSVYTAPAGATITQAAAMPLDDSNILVAWVESIGSQLAVRAAIANCAAP
jgi:hypothetical protein